MGAAGASDRVIDGRYAVVRELGRGGMGAVLLADDLLRPGRQVAVKTIRPDAASDDALGAFRREFSVWSRLKHPGIARVFDFQREAATADGDGGWYLTMEHVDGATLGERVQVGGRLPDKLAAGVGLQLARALAFIHARGVVHRDVHPRNVMLQGVELKLLDFGLAERLRPGDSKPAGTLKYIAPEVLQGKAGPASDVFGLGVTLYEVLTGRAFHIGERPSDVFGRNTSRAKFGVHLAASLEVLGDSPFTPLLERLLAFDPQDRPESASDVIPELGAAVERRFELESQATAEAYVLGAGFVGRQAERAVIDDWRAVEAGGRRVCAVRGPAGIGKSRLIAEVVRQAQLDGLRVLQGEFSRARSRPLAGFEEALSERLGLSSAQADPQAEAAARIERLGRRIQVLARGRDEGALLVLEDLHWADEASHEALLELMYKQSLPSWAPSLRVLVSLRPDESAAADRTLDSLDRRGRLVECKVGRLADVDADGFGAAVFGEGAVTPGLREGLVALSEQAQGVPLHFIEAVRVLLARGRIERTEAGWTLPGRLGDDDLPDGLDGVLRERLAGLSLEEAAWDVLRVLAIMRRPASAELLGRVCEDSGLESLPALERREVVTAEVADDGVRYALSHDLLRRAVLSTAPDLAPLHGRLAAALAAAGDDDDRAADLAHHLLRSDQPAEAAPHLERAADLALARFDNEGALALLDDLVELLEEPGDALLLKRGDALTAAGRWDEARAAYGAVEGPAADARAGRVMVMQGAYDESRPLLEAAVDAMDEGDADLHGALGALGELHFLQTRYDEARPRFEAQLGQAEESADPVRIAAAVGNLGRVALYTARYEDARVLFERQRDLAEGAGALRQMASSLGNLGIVHRRQGRFEDALVCQQRRLRVAEEGGDKQAVGITWGNLAVIHWFKGAVEEAVRCCRRQLAVAEELGDRQSLTSVLGNMGEFLRRRGDLEGSEESFRKALELATELGLSFYEGHYGLGLAELLGELSRWSEAAQLAARALDIAAATSDRAMEVGGRIVSARARCKGRADSPAAPAARERLEGLLQEVADEELQAALHEELYRLGGGPTHAAQAAALYGGLAERNPTAPLRDKARAMERAARGTTGLPDRFEDLMGVVRELSEELSTEEVLTKAVDLAMGFIGGDRGVLLLDDPDGSRVRVARSKDGTPVDGGSLSSTVVNAARDTGEPVLVPNVLADDQLAEVDSVSELELRSVVCLPLRDAAGDPIGVLYVDSREEAEPERLEGDNLRYFQALADQAALAVRNAGRFTALSDRLAAQTQELRTTTEELERSNRDLRELAHSAGHDLKEPLRAITGFCKLLQRKHGGDLGEEASKYLGLVTDGAVRMTEMIEDLLAYSRIETSDWNPSEIDAGGVFDEALLNLTAALAESGGEVTRGELPPVRAPRGQLRSLFQNLVGNALKFRGEAAPQVRVDAVREGDMHHFTVADNGIGIAEELREQVFQVFRRLHSRDRYDGTGIGLAVCRKVVERAGGRIWADETPGGGTTFHFTLPVVGSEP